MRTGSEADGDVEILDIARELVARMPNSRKTIRLPPSSSVSAKSLCTRARMELCLGGHPMAKGIVAELVEGHTCHRRPTSLFMASAMWRS